jgi:hypothetical protein
LRDISCILNYLIIFISFVVISIAILFNPIAVTFGQYSEIPTVSTRNHYDQGDGTPKANTTPYDIIDNANKISSCPPEIVIYVHGVWVGNNSLEEPMEVFDRLSLSLNYSGYGNTLVGYSWDSDTSIDREGNGWNTAKLIAKQNGRILAAFISDYKNDCPNSKLRILAHSLGARVVLEAIETLDNNLLWNQQQHKILSVDLLGGAIDDEEVSTNQNDGNDDNYQPRANTYDPTVKSIYGNAIEGQVKFFNNWYNPEDDVLEPVADCQSMGFFCQPIYYPRYEGDLAIGFNGSQSNITPPNNYNDTNIENEIAFERDANGENGCDLIDPSTLACTIYREGDNHFGYIGFRDGDDRSKLIAYGAIPKVVQSWLIQ